jgi:hypothetical protein
MKKYILFSLAVFIYSLGFSQTSATNFNCTDCNTITHNLFTELNSGKIVVLVWVMPCSSCIAPSRTAYDAVQTYTTSNPGRVVFYLVDDYANTTCATLTSWSNTNAMPNAIKFSNAVINPANYGNVGMPKIIVVGGSTHTIFYNEDNGNNLSGIKPAINLALAATGINENNNIVSTLNIFPNSERRNATILYYLNKTAAINIEVLDITGKILNSFSFGDQASGKHEIQIDLGSLKQGVYFLRFDSANLSKFEKFVISN